MTTIVEIHMQDLKDLLCGKVKPSAIVGKGYKNPKSVASAWLRKEMHNAVNNQSSVQYIGVASNGNAFKTEAKAMQSKAYKSLVDGKFQTFNDARVRDYGVMPSMLGDGYEVYACLS